MIDIESERGADEFETWYTTEFAPKPGANRTMEFTIKEILRVGWLAAKAGTVVVTEEMILAGAWGPINEALKARGVEPFHPGVKPSEPELDTAKTILTAALNGEGK